VQKNALELKILRKTLEQTLVLSYRELCYRGSQTHSSGAGSAMKFPYGLSDFSKIILGGYFYQDRTDRIPLLESAGDQLIFIRPRRFGKSLLLSMLDHYYDVNRAGQFDALFGHLTIGQHPTPLHNQYFVMKWDFSLVKAQGAV
jgi:hypothetical protein